MGGLKWHELSRSVALGFGVGAALSAGCILWKNRSANAFAERNIPDSLLHTPLVKELKVAVKCALLAGSTVKEYLDSEKSVTEKGANAIDFVTSIDVKSEKIIFEILKSEFPNHAFVGEESTAINRIGTHPTWIVDPIDGTTNFLHRNPNVCVSIGLAVGRQAILGVVYAPLFDEMYIAIKDHGSFLNGKRITVSDASRMKDALIETNIGYVRSTEGIRRISDCINAVLLTKCHGLREMGSSVLSLCYLAAGKLDAVHGGCAGDGGYSWDYCAGSLLVTEAGGVVHGIEGGPYNIDCRSILAASTLELHKELIGVIHK